MSRILLYKKTAAWSFVKRPAAALSLFICKVKLLYELKALFYNAVYTAVNVVGVYYRGADKLLLSEAEFQSRAEETFLKLVLGHKGVRIVD